MTAVIVTSLACPVLAQTAAEKKVTMKDLPAPVQRAVEQAGKDATLRGLSAEVEDGKTLYEAEYRVGKQSKDVTFDAQGQVVSTEEETDLASIPAPAAAAIRKAATGGTLQLVETVKESGTTTYEAHIGKGGKTIEVKVDAAGKPVR
jgi:uncharacterized membrane protein YkoI